VRLLTEGKGGTTMTQEGLKTEELFLLHCRKGGEGKRTGMLTAKTKLFGRKAVNQWKKTCGLTGQRGCGQVSWKRNKTGGGTTSRGETRGKKRGKNHSRTTR